MPHDMSFFLLIFLSAIAFLTPSLRLKNYTRTFSWLLACSYLYTTPVFANPLAPIHNTEQSLPPNVVLYVTNDQGLETLGVYGNQDVPTPHIDQFAKEGAYFTQAFASSSSCSVSRATLLSGLHGHVNGMYGHSHLHHHFRSFKSIQSLPALLAKAGYRTARIGKYHVGPSDIYAFEQIFPQQSSTSKNHYGRSLAEMADVVIPFATRNRQQPFFLYMATDDAHRSAPHFHDKPNAFGNRKQGYPNIQRFRLPADQLTVPRYLPDIPEVRDELVELYESTSRIDQGFGRFIDNLKQAGLYKNTLIIFLSASGSSMPNAKTTLYDTGIKLPLIVKAPGQKQHGKIDDALISWVDITPTILDYASVNTDITFNGNSFRSLLEQDARQNFDDNPAEKKHAPYKDHFDEVYGSHTFHEITMYYPMRMVRTRQYKLIWNIAYPLQYPTGLNIYDSSTNTAIRERKITHLGKRPVSQYEFRAEYELYDIQNDPEEVNNLAKNQRYTHTLNHLKQKLEHFQRATEDPWQTNHQSN